jgi:hypothetical protein
VQGPYVRRLRHLEASDPALKERVRSAHTRRTSIATSRPPCAQVTRHTCSASNPGQAVRQLSTADISVSDTYITDVAARIIQARWRQRAALRDDHVICTSRVAPSAHPHVQGSAGPQQSGMPAGAIALRFHMQQRCCFEHSALPLTLSHVHCHLHHVIYR